MDCSSLLVTHCKSHYIFTLSLASFRSAYSLAYRAGVVTAITQPQHTSFISGLSTAFSLGALHGLEEGAVIRDVVALHVSLAHGDVPGISTEIAALRRYILHPPSGEAEVWVTKLKAVSEVVLFTS